MNGFADQLGWQEGKTLWVETLCLMLWLCADGLGRFFCSIFVWCGFFFFYCHKPSSEFCGP